MLIKKTVLTQCNGFDKDELRLDRRASLAMTTVRENVIARTRRERGNPEKFVNLSVYGAWLVPYEFASKKTLTLGVLLFILSFITASVADCPSKAFLAAFAKAAAKRSECQVTYDPTYTKIPYPMGDVAGNKGVCTDVVIRSLRTLGVDLQELVHKDMKESFSKYPKKWGLKSPDTNIDHRRVPNLETFFTRMGARLSLSTKASDYAPGDIVTFLINKKLPHIGVVVTQKTENNKRHLVVHNIGRGPEIDDILEVDGHSTYGLKMTGHFRYVPKICKLQDHP